MLMAEAKEQEFTGALQSFACVSFADIPLAKASHLTIWPELRCVKEHPTLQSHMAKNTNQERDKEFNSIYQMGQRELKIYP